MPSELLNRYRQVRAATEAACVPLSPEDMVVQSMPDASPAKWHLAHTTWFFETFVLSNSCLGRYEPHHPEFGYLFNSYYEAVGPRHPRPLRGLLTRPSVDEVLKYRGQIDVKMAEILPGMSRDDQLFSIVELGLNHEQQHLELLLTDIKHALAQNPLKPAYWELPSPCDASVASMGWRSFPAGVYEIGFAGAGFCFDNERPRHRVFLEPFEIGARPVSCGEFIQFMEEGGYSRPEFWLADGWKTCRQEDWQAPLYWERHGTCWHVFTLGGRRPVAVSEPVAHVSFYEADAYARWAQCRLPTEAEWETACISLSIGLAHDHDAFGPRRLHPAPMTDDGAGLFDDLWTWTQSPYVAYLGFKPGPGALGEYNGKFMCNQIVLRGGSCLTPGSHLRATYRNFFPPESRWQFTGLRLARSA